MSIQFCRHLPATQARLYNDRPMIKRASLHSLGCRLNQAETSVLASQCGARGMLLSTLESRPIFLVVNTCS